MFDLPTYRWDPVPQAFEAAAAELDRLALALEAADPDVNIPKADGVRLAADHLRRIAAHAREAASEPQARPDLEALRDSLCNDKPLES